MLTWKQTFTIVMCLIGIFICMNIALHLAMKWFANNPGVQQLSLWHKIEFVMRFGLNFKMGVFGKRERDFTLFGRFFKNDPFLVKFFRRLQTQYGKVAAFDTPLSKLFLVLDPDLSEKVLETDHAFGPAKMKDYVFQSFMATNVAAMRGQARVLKRRFNEEVFGTKKVNSMFGHIQPTIDQALIKKPLHSHELRDMNFEIMSELFMGNTDPKVLTTFKDFIDYVKTDSDFSFTSMWYKFFPNKKVISSFQNVIQDSLQKSSPVNHTLQRRNTVMEVVKSYVDKYNDKNEQDIHNEFPHWIVPLHVMMNESIPHALHIILSFPKFYHKIQASIYSQDFDLYQKNTYFHYFILEHLRMFNIINITMFRKTDKDIVIDGIQFPKNTEIQLLNYTILRNPNRYKNPDSFIPERWETKSVEEQNILFGHGMQQCPSIQFSPFFMKCYVYVMLTKFRYQPLKHNVYKNIQMNTSLLKYTFVDE